MWEKIQKNECIINFIFCLYIFSNQRLLCDNTPRKHNKSSSSNTDILLLCCQEDMCNHVDNPDHKKLKPNLTDDSEGEFSLMKHNNLIFILKPHNRF